MNPLARLFSRWSEPPHLRLGRRGEKLAAQFLRKRGYQILVRRFRGRRGEIDLACRCGDTLVFVEVKTRVSEEFGEPSAAVDSEKRKRITRTAREYLREIGNPDIPFRFDIVEVVMADSRRAADIRLQENAFPMETEYRY